MVLNPRLIVLLALLCTALIYLPGMTGGFVFDDYVNILQNENISGAKLSFADLVEAGWSGFSGPLKRPIAMVSFALNFATTGEFIGAFKFTNLVIHLTSGVLIFVMLSLLMRARTFASAKHAHLTPVIAAIAATIWLIHPVNLTTVLYVVQRMNGLAALFSFACVICFLAGRLRLEQGRPHAWWFIAIGAPLFFGCAMLSKENSIVTVPLIGLLEICFFRLRTHADRDRKILIALFVVTLGIPGVCAAVYLAMNPEYYLAQYEWRAFTLLERLMTECRVLWFYVFLIVIPRLRDYSLYHDDFGISHGLFEPMSTFFAIAGIGCALITAVVARRRCPILTFGIGWFLIGHSLEAGIFALELAHEHRNYLPSIGPIFAICYGVTALAANENRRGLLRIGALTIIVLLGSLTYLRAGDWSAPSIHATLEAQRRPNSFRAVYDLARIQYGLYLISRDETEYELAIANLARSAELDVNAKRPLASIVRLEYDRGQTPDPKYTTELLRRYRHSLFHWSESFELHLMVKCRARGRCLIPREYVFSLINAALSNPTLPPDSKAQLLVDLAIFYLNEANDIEPALQLLEDAANLKPKRFSYRRVQVQVLIRAKKFAEAEKELQAMRAVSIWEDKLFKPVDEILAIETRLKDAIDAQSEALE